MSTTVSAEKPRMSTLHRIIIVILALAFFLWFIALPIWVQIQISSSGGHRAAAEERGEPDSNE
jgi:hypothetical protein